MQAADPLYSTVVLLGSGVTGLAIAKFAHISPIVGFFILGAVIGPQALGLVDHSPTIHLLGELGVCFLLFDIGLHLSLKELRRGWRAFLASGVLQFLISTSALCLMARAFGLHWSASLVLGAILSLSSTALVLKILSDEREDSSPIGKRATEVLVFQDIIAILLLVILSGDLSKGLSWMALATPLAKMAAAAIVVVFFGRLALKPLFRLLIALKSDEVITAFALLLVFLGAWATQSLGLSLALGAFLGGLALSESSYSYLVRGELAPFRSLLLSLFFLSVGINLDLLGISSNIFLLIGLLMLFSALKTVANLVSFRAARIERGLATLLSFLLAQGSEFAFVLLGLAITSGLVEGSVANLAVSLVGLSLAATPLLAAAGCYLSRSVCHVQQEDDATESDPPEVVIVRIDDFGRQLASLLDAERIPYRAHDNDIERLAYAKSRGLNVYFSDVNRPRTLGRASLGKVVAVVSLLEEDHMIDPLLEGLRKVDLAIPILAATESHARIEKLNSMGIESTFIKSDRSVIALFEALLIAIGFEPSKIEESISRALRLLEPEELFPTLASAESLEAQPLAA